jgi:hypothetical protein
MFSNIFLIKNSIAIFVGADVRIILEGTDSFDNMFASVYYSDGNTVKDLY